MGSLSSTLQMKDRSKCIPGNVLTLLKNLSTLYTFIVCNSHIIYLALSFIKLRIMKNSPFCMFIGCVYVCVYAFTCRCTCSMMCIWMSEDNLGCWFSPSTLSDTGSLCWSQVRRPGQLAHKLPRIHLPSCRRSAGITDVWFHTQFYLVYGDSNSRLHTHAASTLPTEPSPKNFDYYKQNELIVNL